MQHPKLYVITREDLSPGQQATQSTHAALQFVFEHHDIAEEWYRESSYLVLLSVRNEDSLLDVLDIIVYNQLVHSTWTEPDMDNQHTAVAIGPSEQATRVFSNLPLTLKRGLVMS